MNTMGGMDGFGIGEIINMAGFSMNLGRMIEIGGKIRNDMIEIPGMKMEEIEDNESDN